MLLFITVWLAVLSIATIYLFSIFLRLFKTKDRGLKQAIFDTLESNRKLSSDVKTISGDISTLQLALKNNYQKSAIVRFNPFERLGGEQSYCLAVINQNNSGVVLTFLYTKEGVRAYMKEVYAGKAKGADLSTEEKEAIQQAISNN